MSGPHIGATVCVRGETFKAESETADLWQIKWNENQTVPSTAICTPERDTGPIEGAAGSRWPIEIMERSLAVCGLLSTVQLHMLACGGKRGSGNGSTLYA